MDQVLKVAEMLTEKLAQIAEQYGPAAADVALALARVEATGQLLKGFAWVGVVMGLFLLGRYCFNKGKTPGNVEEWYIPAFLSGLLGALAFIPASIYLFNIWNWVGVIEPKLWLAYRVIEKVL